MGRKLILTITAKRSVLADQLLYVSSPETHSTLLLVPSGEGAHEGTVEIEIIDTKRFPEGSDPLFEVHSLQETWPTDRLVIESSAGLSQRAVYAMFPELYAEDDEYGRLPTPMLSSTAYELVGDDGPIGLWRPSGERCPWCNTVLLAIVDLDLTSDQLAFLGVQGERLSVLTCHGCSCYTPIYVDVDVNGSCQWRNGNERPARIALGEWSEYQDRRSSIGAILPQPDDRDEAIAVDEKMAATVSHIGGRPRWVQYWAYPSCPKCDEPMPSLGQIDEGGAPNHAGTYFVFVDLPCGVACTIYQHT